MTSIAGIDVSAIGQGASFDWAAERGTIGFAFAKASEGLTFDDPDFARNWADIKAEGIVRGAYHFGHPSLSAQEQAAYFLGIVKAQGLAAGDLLALDLEDADGLPAAAVAAWAVSFTAAVHAAVAAWPVVYANDSFILDGFCAGLGACPLWFADPSGLGLPHGPWSLVSFEQTGVRGTDLDVFYGNAAQLAKLGVPAPAPAPAPEPEYWQSIRLPDGAARMRVSNDGGMTLK
jgi:lysozyme